VARKRKQGAKAQQAVLPLMGPHAAGIDIGATEIWVAVPVDRPPRMYAHFRLSRKTCTGVPIG
jgi:hypothetical protein